MKSVPSAVADGFDDPDTPFRLNLTTLPSFCPRVFTAVHRFAGSDEGKHSASLLTRDRVNPEYRIREHRWLQRVAKV
jgi:hypothetical protein